MIEKGYSRHVELQRFNQLLLYPLNLLCRHSPLTASNILIIDFYVIISVWSALFMPSSKGVKDFMDYDSFVFTASAYGNSLSRLTSSSNVRITSVAIICKLNVTDQ